MKLSLPFFRTSSGIELGDGVHLVGRTPASLVLQMRKGAEVETRVVAAQQGLRLLCSLDGQRSSIAVVFADQGRWEHSPGSEQACKTQFEALSRSLARQPRSWWRVGSGVFGAILLMILLFPAPAPAPAIAALPGEVLSPMPEQASAPSGSNLDAAELAQVKSAPGIVMAKGSRQFAVFTDPNCPYCRELERSLSKIDDDLAPIVLPVGFKPGSRDAAAAALCSPDPAKAWRQLLIEGVAPAAAACEKGYAAVDTNMALFQRLRLNSTPTMISPSGVVVVGSGDPQKIQLVMAQ